MEERTGRSRSSLPRLGKKALKRVGRVARKLTGLPIKQEFLEQEDIVKTDILKTPFVKVSLGSPLPHWLAIIPDKSFDKTSTKIKKLAKKHNLSCEVYPGTQVDKSELKLRFQGIEGLETLASGTYIRIHDKKYCESTLYHREHVAFSFQIALEMLRNAGAQTIVLDSSLYQDVKSNNVARASVVDAGSATVSETLDESSRSSNMVTVTYSKLLYKPSIESKDWYLQLAGTSKIIALVLDQVKEIKNHPVSGLRLEFLKEQHYSSSNVAELNSLFKKAPIGAAITVENSHNIEDKYTVEVTFFDNQAILAAKKVGTPRTKTMDYWKRSLSKIATVRMSYMKYISMAREDVLFALKNGQSVQLFEVTPQQAIDAPPMDDKVQKAMYKTIQALVKEGLEPDAVYNQLALAASAMNKDNGSIVDIPFIVYGPQGSGKTSALFTWFASVEYTHSHFVEDGFRGWRRFIDSPQTIMLTTIAKFSQFRSDYRSEITNEQYELMSSKNMARAILSDTLPAVSASKDVRGGPFGFGMQILVLDFNEMKSMDDKALKVVEPLLGPKTTGHGGLLRYPPVAIVLAKCAEPRSKEAKIVKKWCVDTFDVRNVCPMETLHFPDDWSEATTIQRKKYYDTIKDALRILTEIIDACAYHEQITIMQSLNDQVSEYIAH